MIKDKTALIIDCANVGWASSYAFSYMQHNDENVGVLYGFLYQLLSFTEVSYPHYIIFAWDSMKSRRKLLYPDYKKKDEVDLSEEKIIAKQITEHQLDLLRYEILPLIGFQNHFYKTGFEADDVIASIVLEYDFDMSFIMSNDNDLYQCLTDKVHIYNHKEKAIVTPRVFFDMHSIPPSLWARVKSLAGCTSDKVPGVPGVKEVRAIQYLKGELSNKSVAHKNIIEAINNKTLERDKKLVTLPYERLHFDIKKDTLDLKKFTDILNQYGLYKLYKSGYKNKWRDLFNNINR